MEPFGRLTGLRQRTLLLSGQHMRIQCLCQWFPTEFSVEAQLRVGATLGAADCSDSQTDPLLKVKILSSSTGLGLTFQNVSNKITALMDIQKMKKNRLPMPIAFIISKPGFHGFISRQRWTPVGWLAMFLPPNIAFNTWLDDHHELTNWIDGSISFCIQLGNIALIMSGSFSTHYGATCICKRQPTPSNHKQWHHSL